MFEELLKKKSVYDTIEEVSKDILNGFCEDTDLFYIPMIDFVYYFKEAYETEYRKMKEQKSLPLIFIMVQQQTYTKMNTSLICLETTISYTEKVKINVEEMKENILELCKEYGSLTLHRHCILQISNGEDFEIADYADFNFDTMDEKLLEEFLKAAFLTHYAELEICFQNEENRIYILHVLWNQTVQKTLKLETTMNNPTLHCKVVGSFMSS